MTRQEEYRHKHGKVVEYLESHSLDAIVLVRRANFAWLTAGGLNHVGLAGEVGVSPLLVTRERTVCATHNIEAPRVADEELADLGIETVAWNWFDPADAARRWQELLGDARLACDAAVPGLSAAASLPGDFVRLRWSLLPSEIERYRVTAKATAQCLEETCRQVRPGMTEHEVAGALAGRLLARGIRPCTLLVAADDRVACYRHPIPTGRSFGRYGMAVAGGERHGLVVSCSRLFSFGPIPADLARRHEAVCRVDAAFMAATRPGRTLGDIFADGQQAYAEVGFSDEWQLHHQGGSTGYAPREVKAGPGDETPVLDHQAFAWNPSIAGSKSEDTILVEPAGVEILSATDHWPCRPYEAGGRSWLRPDILIL